MLWRRISTQGLYTPQYTPVGRGFDEMFGFLEGGEDHNTSKTFGNFCHNGEADLSHNQLGSDDDPFPYTWPECTGFAPLPDTAVFEYYHNPGAVDIESYNPYDGVFETEEECAALCSGCVVFLAQCSRNQSFLHATYIFLHCSLAGAPSTNAHVTA